MVVAFAHPADAGAAADSGGAGSARTAARFVLKGALPAVSARKDGVATPPQRQHSAQAVAQARAENGGAASGIADGSPVRSA